MLQALNGVGHQQGKKAEDKQRKGILLPFLLRFWIDPAELVDTAFDGAEEARQWLALALEDTEHEVTERFGKNNDRHCINENLQPTDGCHCLLLRTARATRARLISRLG